MLGYATGTPEAFSIDSAPANMPSDFHQSSLRVPPRRLVTRIGDTNLASIRLFEKLGFKITKKVEVFKEVEMRYQRLNT